MSNVVFLKAYKDYATSLRDGNADPLAGERLKELAGELVGYDQEVAEALRHLALCEKAAMRIQDLLFTCEACRKRKPSAEISVLHGDLGHLHNLPEGIVTRNVNYCKDSADCRERAYKIASAAESPSDEKGSEKG